MKIEGLEPGPWPLGVDSKYTVVEFRCYLVQVLEQPGANTELVPSPLARPARGVFNFAVVPSPESLM